MIQNGNEKCVTHGVDVRVDSQENIGLGSQLPTHRGDPAAVELAVDIYQAASPDGFFDLGPRLAISVKHHTLRVESRHPSELEFDPADKSG